MMHVSSEELPSTLMSIAAALRPGGIVSFESRNPAFREWERWTPEATRGERVTSVGRLREWLDVTDVCGGRVVFDAHNLFPNGGSGLYQHPVLPQRGGISTGACGRRLHRYHMEPATGAADPSRKARGFSCSGRFGFESWWNGRRILTLVCQMGRHR
jgi:hypothetical protein